MPTSPFDFESTAAGPTRSRRPAGLQYVEAYIYYFNHPNWFLNLLLATLCQLIPVVGPIVLLGYEYELILAKHRRTTRTYPDFDFGRFIDYLTRGIWPFLVQLIQALVMVPLMMIVIVAILLLVGMSAAAQGPKPLVLLAVFPVMFVAFAIILALSAVVMTPLVLRAGLTRDFGKTFDFAFVKDFMHRVGWETVYATAFLIVSGWLVMLLGLLACFFGIYPATTLILLAHTHLQWQLYELYLERGGMPIPLPEDEVVLAERV